MKIGFEPSDPNEITIITTVKDGELFQNEPDFPIFEQSMAIISDNTNNSLNSYVGTNGYSGVYYPRDNPSPIYFNYAKTSALLSSYTVNGELRWEKTIDADDAPLQAYPGDWKEQECVYQVAKGSDGEYVFVGNTSHNKDDYLIAKVYGNCHFDISYNIAPPNPVVDNKVVLSSGIVNWNPAAFGGNTDIYVRGEIHVPAGTTLQITGGLIVHFADGNQMEYDTKLIIEPGGRLLVNNATLTSTDCPGAMWRGIEVWGNSELSQTVTSNQGFVQLTNQAKIENAYEAVQLWKSYDWTSTGGIIRATNSHFINNKRDIQFLAYANIHNGIEHNNLSFFNNCTFQTDNSYKLETINPHITMFKVSGINIMGCDFMDEKAVTFVEPHSLNRGIFSMDAKYKVLGRFTGSASTLDAYYDDSNYDVCTFTNLLSGVQAMNANSQNTITVDHCLFTDCRFGVYLSQVDNTMITRNKFVKASDYGLFTSQYGIYTNKCTAYQIEGNIVEIPFTAGSTTLGIAIHNSGFEDNEVYKNILDGTVRGVNSFGKNRNDGTIALTNYEGLEFKCNQHIDNLLYDESVVGLGILDGEKIVQGTLSLPARNEFSSVSSGGRLPFSEFCER